MQGLPSADAMRPLSSSLNPPRPLPPRENRPVSSVSSLTHVLPPPRELVVAIVGRPAAGSPVRAEDGSDRAFLRGSAWDRGQKPAIGAIPHSPRECVGSRAGASDPSRVTANSRWEVQSTSAADPRLSRRIGVCTRLANGRVHVEGARDPEDVGHRSPLRRNGARG